MTTSADAQPCSHPRSCYNINTDTCGCGMTGLQIAVQRYERKHGKPAAAPVWRPCTDRPMYAGVYRRRGQCQRFQAWNGEFWCESSNVEVGAQKQGQLGRRSAEQDGEWLDPAPGHEEQRESAGVYGTERSNPHPPLPTDSHPTIEQDRQAWRSWFGAYSEPVRKFGEHDA